MKIFFLFIPLFLVHNVYSQGPVLCFSDIISGPKTGNSDHSQENQTGGRDGSIVTIWGANLGNHQNNNEVLVGNQKARVYYWGNATFPADLYKVHKLQKISFQIPETVDTGNTEISVIVNGIKSNSLPFRVREGKIYFVDKMGDDVAGDGSWDKPWKTLDNADYTGALEKIKPGDLLYVKDGFVHTELVGDRSCFDIGNPGTRELPKAIIAYPQANVQIGDTSTLKTFSLWVSGYGPSTNWVISGLKLTAKTEAVSMYHNFRVVGNYITAPNGNGPTGAVAGQGNDLYLLGNELTEIGNLNTSKLYHPIYIQSAEACSGPRLPLEKNRVIAFNYLHDNLSYDGINLYRECGSSAYMTDHKVFNNAIINQTGCGIRCGDYVVGENHIYNNLLVNCGLGPDPINAYAMHVPMHIHAGWDDTTSMIHCYNNTIVGGGFRDGQEWSSSMVGFDQNRPFLLDFRNNIVVSNIQDIAYYNSRFEEPVGAKNNLWFGNGPGPAWDAGGISTNPMFIGPDDYSLSSQSPAIDKSIGYDNGNQVLPEFDFFMNKRSPFVDLGAFEFIQNVSNSSDQDEMVPTFYKYHNNIFEILPAFSNAFSYTEVYSSYGHYIIKSNNQPLDLNTFPSGMYIIRHHFGDETFVSKVIVMK